VTALVQKQAEVSLELAKAGGELSGELKQLAARNIGNRSATWEKAYDLLIKVNEAKVMESIMKALRAELAKEVEKSKLLSRKRVRVQGLASPPQKVEEEKGGRPSWWGKAWGWMRGG
jgi:hypothetical protein